MHEQRHKKVDTWEMLLGEMSMMIKSSLKKAGKPDKVRFEWQSKRVRNRSGPTGAS